MTTNADITIFNKAYDPATRSEVFMPTVIRGVSLCLKTSSSAGDKKQDKRTTGVIRIPISADTSGKRYVNGVLFRTLGKDGVSNVWTIQLGDLIVPHIADNLVVHSETDLLRRFDEVIVIREFADNTTRGSRFVRHWRIGGM